MRRRFLFVSGCPRSGTTIMATILNWSDSAFVSQERFAPLLRRDPSKFLPGLYSLPRLLSFEPGDCGYDSYPDKREYWVPYANPKAYQNPAQYEFIGDKITHLFRRLDLFGASAWREEEITVVHVIRNVREVVASYEARRLNPSDDWQHDRVQAVRDWTDSMECVHAYRHVPGANVRVLLVDYDAIFSGGKDQFISAAERIFGHLGLGFGARQREGMAIIHDASGRFRQARRPYDGDPGELDSLLDPSTVAIYHELQRHCI